MQRKEAYFGKKIKYFMLPKDEADEKNAIIEIRAGTRARGILICI